MMRRGAGLKALLCMSQDLCKKTMMLKTKRFSFAEVTAIMGAPFGGCIGGGFVL
jgi:hypothetical protein